jgi:hypothetical protein
VANRRARVRRGARRRLGGVRRAADRPLAGRFDDRADRVAEALERRFPAAVAARDRLIGT